MEEEYILPSTIDEDLLNMSWNDLDMKDLDFDLDTVGLLDDTLSSINTSKNESFQNLENLSFINEASDPVVLPQNSSNSQINNNQIHGNQLVEDISTNPNYVPRNTNNQLSNNSHINFQSKPLINNSNISNLQTTTINNIQTNIPNILQNQINLNGATLVQITPQQSNTIPVTSVQRVVASTSATSVSQGAPTVIRHVVLSNNESTTTTPSVSVLPQTLLYKPQTLATISTPIQGSDTTLVTSIPFLLDSDSRVPVARLVNSNIGLQSSTFPREKKSSHNEIEKRYRCSINDKILELKNLVAGEESKLHKSQILKKAIDYIKFLLNQNARLRNELNSYRMKDNKQKVSDLLVSCSTPPYSDTSSPQHSPLSENSLSPAPDLHAEKDENSGQPPPYNMVPNSMTEKSRMILCMMMFAILSLNPIGIFVNKDSAAPFTGDSDGKGGRILMNVDDDFVGNSLKNMFCSSLTVWLLNGVILLMMLVKLFVYGEPIVKKKTLTSDTFKKFVNLGDVEMNKGNYNLASQHFCQALASVGRPLPVSIFDKVLALQWQIFRQILQRLYIGKWLARQAGGFFIEKALREDAGEWISEISIVYHKLNKLHIMSHTDDPSHILGLYFALASLNLAECVNMRDDIMADIYLTSALRARESLPSRWHLMARFLLAKARRVCERSGKMPEAFQWLYSPRGHRFFVSHKWSYDAKRRSLFSKFTNKAEPLAYLLVLYREHLLQRAISTLVNPGQKTDDICEGDAKKRTKTSDVLDYLQLLTEVCSQKGKYYDEVSLWWGKVCGVAVYWLLGENEESEKLFPDIETLPEKLKLSSDPLPQAILHALRARRQMENLSHFIILKLCEKAGNAVADSINISSCKDDNSIMQYVQVLVYDWILDVRTTIWERETAKDCDTLTIAPIHMLKGFQSDLAALRKLMNVVPGVLQRVFLHEATLRMMAGASPARTQQLLDRSLRHRYRQPSVICGKDKNLHSAGGEREHATALMMACRHLPSQLLASPGERAGMLTEAAKTLEKIGDTKRMQDCYNLMKNMSNTVTAY